MNETVSQSVEKDLSGHYTYIVFLDHSLPHLCIPLIPNHFTTQVSHAQIAIRGYDFLLLKYQWNAIYQKDGDFSLLRKGT